MIMNIIKLDLSSSKLIEWTVPDKSKKKQMMESRRINQLPYGEDLAEPLHDLIEPSLFQPVHRNHIESNLLLNFHNYWQENWPEGLTSNVETSEDNCCSASELRFSNLKNEILLS